MTALLSQRPRADRAFERLYKRHVLDVYRYALVVLPTPQDAEDVTQTTFLNAYRAFKGGERPKAPRNWLMGIAHEVCRRRFRQTARGYEEVELHDTAVAAVDEEGPTAQDIRRALGRLDFDERAALVMREVEGRSYQEIAEVLEHSVNEVETLVFRARRALREELEGSLTCHEAERAVSHQLDGLLPRSERASLRQHLRECEDCADFARSQDNQRTALRRYAMVPLPSSLASFFTAGAADAEDTSQEGRKFSPSPESF
jgi:RNA polymerase sigma-70 factor (ECF subfamily)